MPKLTTESLRAYKQPSEKLQAHFQCSAALVELVEMGGHVFFSARHLDRLHRPERLAQESHRGIRRFAAELVIGQDAPPKQAREDDRAEERQENHQGDGQVDAGHDDHRDARRDPLADLVGEPGGKVADFADVLVKVEAVERFAGGNRQGLVAGAAQDAGEEVRAQQGRVVQAEGHAKPFVADGDEQAQRARSPGRE